MEYEIHPLCKILPEMSTKEYGDLVDDIRSKGLVRPITLFDGMILDGRHRFSACNDAGVAPRFEQYEGNDPAGFVASSCVHRSLNATQRALISAGFLEYEREQARDRLKTNEGGARGLPPEHFPEAQKGEARDRAGARMHVSGKTVSVAAQVLKSAAPEVVEKMRGGEMALNEAKKIAHLNHAAQKRIVELPKNRRTEELAKANARSAACKQRDAAVEVVKHEGTPFLRTFLSALERLAIYCAENRIKSAHLIAQTFEQDMDWNSQPLIAQYERCIPIIDALEIIREHKLAAA